MPQVLCPSMIILNLCFHWLFCRTWKRSAINNVGKVLWILNISVAKVCKFPVCMVTDPSFSKNFSKDDVLSLYKMRRYLSCIRLIFLFIAELWLTKESYYIVVYSSNSRAIITKLWGKKGIHQQITFKDTHVKRNSR